MRIFVPATIARLGRLNATGTLEGSTGFAVTAALRAAVDTDNDDELEFVALAYAAYASLGLLGDDPSAPPLRVVVVVEADLPTPDGSPGEALSSGAELDAEAGEVALPPVHRDAVVAVHVDDAGAEPAITAVLDTWRSTGEWPDLDDLDDHALMWFAPQELAALLSR